LEDMAVLPIKYDVKRYGRFHYLRILTLKLRVHCFEGG
jgi:hypothetical protein